MDNALYQRPTVDNEVARMFGMQPNMDRLNLLPRYDRKQGWIAPNVLYQMARAALSPGVAAQGGQVSEEDAVNFAGNVSLGGAASIAALRNPAPGRPGKTVGMATAYHGSPKAFDAFDPSAPKTTGGPFNKYGVSVSKDKTVAQRYAKDFSPDGGNVYTVDVESVKPLSLSAREFNSLQDRVGDFDAGRWSESKDIDIELLFKKHGIPFASGEHPIEAIKKAGFDAIETAGSIRGAESEMLVFNEKLLRILSRE
jgi:hypothetical protein